MGGDRDGMLEEQPIANRVPERAQGDGCREEPGSHDRKLDRGLPPRSPWNL